MNYKLHYNILIDRARNRQPIDSYCEQHHVVPRCMGGVDTIENLVYLTPEEHYTAHQLLVKIYPTEDKLVYAALMMCVGNNRSNKRYGWLKRKYHAICKQRTGQKNGSFGTMWISNPDTSESRKISKDVPIPPGFVAGRNVRWKICKVCSANHLNTIIRSSTCSSKCSKQFKQKISDDLANLLLLDYENGMPMKDMLVKYGRKSEQSISTFLRKRFPGRKKFLPRKREISP